MLNPSTARTRPYRLNAVSSVERAAAIKTQANCTKYVCGKKAQRGKPTHYHPGTIYQP